MLLLFKKQKGIYMKKLLIVLFSLLLLTACAGTKTVTDKAEAKKMAEEFYDELLASDPIMMNSYFNDKLFFSCLIFSSSF